MIGIPYRALRRVGPYSGFHRAAILPPLRCLRSTISSDGFRRTFPFVRFNVTFQVAARVFDQISRCRPTYMDDTPNIKPENINRFLCESWGADMAWDAGAGGLLCGHCGHTRTVTPTGRVDEQSYLEFVEDGAARLQ